MVENKPRFVNITEETKQELLSGMRYLDYEEFEAGKEGKDNSDLEQLNKLINSCQFNYACYIGEDLLFCSGLRLNAFYNVLSVFWLLSTQKVQKHRISYFKALKTLCKEYLTHSPQGIMCTISEHYEQAYKLAKIFNFKKIGEATLDKLKHFIYILLGDN